MDFMYILTYMLACVQTLTKYENIKTVTSTTADSLRLLNHCICYKKTLFKNRNESPSNM
jgi:hypothetical protein